MRSYQANVDIPGPPALCRHPELLLQDAAKQGLAFDKDSVEFRALAKRIEDGDASDLRPSQQLCRLSGLLLPVLAGWTVAAWRARRSPTLAAAPGERGARRHCPPPLPSAFWSCSSRCGNTHSKGAISPCSWSLYSGPCCSPGAYAESAGIAAACALSVFLLVFAGLRVGPARRSFDRVLSSFAVRMEYRTATVSMIKDIPGWVSGRELRPLLSALHVGTAVEQIQDPHNFMLEIWRTRGCSPLAALLLGTVVFFKRTFAYLWSRNRSARRGQCRRPASGRGLAAVEFYLGGMAASFGFAYWAWQQMNPT